MANRIYNPKTGKWEDASAESLATSLVSSNDDFAEELQASISTSTEQLQQQAVPASEGTISSSAKAEADKEYIYTEYNTLQGELQLIANKNTINIKVGNTIRIEGIGRFLSGLYYVSAIKRTLDASSGYKHSFTVVKTGFGDSLKKAYSTPVKSVTASIVSKTPTPISVNDKVKFLTVASNTYKYSNAHEGVFVPRWVTEKTHTVNAISSDGSRVRLKEINSWTYTKYLKKV